MSTRKQRSKRRQNSTGGPDVASNQQTSEPTPGRDTSPEPVDPVVRPKLPKGAIRKLNIGQSFAEYDSNLTDPNVYVYTPALSAAEDSASGKFFFVGRRGTGKTAIRRYCDLNSAHARVIVPEIFSPSSTILELQLLENVKQKPFRSLVTAFRRALQIELLTMWQVDHPHNVNVPHILLSELAELGDLDFDLRCIRLISRISSLLANGDDEAWLQENRITKSLAEEMKPLVDGPNKHTLLIDSIDDYWEGSDEGLIYLTAFMHACLEVSTQIPWARTILFLRENIFDRVRAVDSESARIETAIVNMEWTDARLLELVERRFNKPFTTKFALGGLTWNAFVENPDEAWATLMQYCQKRPRDVLMYVSNAVESAQNAGHDLICSTDIEQARRKFSDNRLKDLGDEYSENHPQISLVLSRFYGLGTSFTVAAIETLIQKLLNDATVVKACGSWLYGSASTEQFIRLLYNIGFVGIRDSNKPPKFRALGSQDTSPPPISAVTDVVIHRSYWDALDLQNVLVRDIPADKDFGRIGIIEDLPGGLNSTEYLENIELIEAELKSLPHGTPGATDFEDIVGDVVRLCFFRALSNVEAKSRDVSGKVIRDWVASNRAQGGFWQLVLQKYGADNVIWECKNYANLAADDFHQAEYYMSNIGGRFVVIAFRGEVAKSYYDHIRRIASSKRGFVLLLTERDLLTFLRQAKNGKIKEDHIQDRYDGILRKIS